jgi:hypothetical protein
MLVLFVRKLAKVILYDVSLTIVIICFFFYNYVAPLEQALIRRF